MLQAQRKAKQLIRFAAAWLIAAALAGTRTWQSQQECLRTRFPSRFNVEAKHIRATTPSTHINARGLRREFVAAHLSSCARRAANDPPGGVPGARAAGDDESRTALLGATLIVRDDHRLLWGGLVDVMPPRQDARQDKARDVRPSCTGRSVAGEVK